MASSLLVCLNCHGAWPQLYCLLRTLSHGQYYESGLGSLWLVGDKDADCLNGDSARRSTMDSATAS